MAVEVAELINKLAERAVSGKQVGPGSLESRSAALIMRAIDDLAMAAQTDAANSAGIYQIITKLKDLFSSPSPKSAGKVPPTEESGNGEEEDEDEKEKVAEEEA